MLENTTITKLKKIKDFDQLYYLPRELLKNKRCKTTNLKILIINTPCNGFGDLIFSWKLTKLLTYYYKAQVKIATTLSKGLIDLGFNSKNVYRLVSKTNPNSVNLQCRKYASLQILELNRNKQVNTNQFDLFFAAPVMADFDPDLKDVKRLIPQSTYFNTIFFSEYNDNINKGFDFNTGVGEGRDGLMFLPKRLINISSKAQINQLLNNNSKFALAYIADIKGGWIDCIKNFAKMIAAKYKYNKMQLICPSFAAKNLSNKNTAINIFGKYYSDVIITYKQGKKIIEKNINVGNYGGTFYIRGDILPISNDKMLGLIKYSVKDILLTGDQSITDALSCCEKKNIFYQIAPWKRNLGHNLAKLMPQRYLNSNKTSCGSLKAISYNSNYHNFVKKWDFMKNAGSELKSIMCMTSLSKSNSKDGRFLKEYMDIVESSNSVESVEKKLTSWT